ncbi:MAG TPA: sugar ABC transporter ATP-binding protein [Spirochaetota bacterium]|nr:sugar ABC transporter ATP-binding protein [Spirochaetota bacterium]
MQKKTYISFYGITKTFPGVKALDDISFSISAGEVHAIVGENGAGKSTLINVVAGNYHPDSGQLEIKGDRVRIRNYAEALDMGISVVYQERSLVPNLSVAENIFVDRQPRAYLGFINKKKMYEEAEKICKSIKLEVRPNTLVGNLIPAKQQMVEIAKALSNESELLILDEPTATITENETAILFQVIKELKKKGISIIYISHRLQEIFNIADRVTVLKDGKYVGTRTISEVNVGDVIKMMVGRDLYTEKYRSSSKEETVLEVRNFKSRKFHDVSFELKRGEVLCFAGLAGAGRTEVARAVIGADPLESGELYVYGTKKRIANPEQAIENGIGYLPEDRKEQGLFLDMAISKNIVSGNLGLVSKYQIINEKSVLRVSEEYKEKLRIVCPSVLTKTKQISGGNQQKIVFARWLLANPKILIIDEPTRGIDVGAKAEIYRIIRELASQGASIIVISSDLREVLTLSDRILVMYNGTITGELTRHEATEENIMHLASGFERKEEMMV